MKVFWENIELQESDKIIEDWRKSQLISFCKENNLTTHGNKIELLEKAQLYLKDKNNPKYFLKVKRRIIKKIHEF